VIPKNGVKPFQWQLTGPFRQKIWPGTRIWSRFHAESARKALPSKATLDKFLDSPHSGILPFLAVFDFDPFKP
jgi:hypothetical protein